MDVTGSSQQVERFNPFGEQVAGPYFVGREKAVATFEDRLRGLQAARPNHMFIAGLNGTGKTSYLDHVAGLAEAAGHVAVTVIIDERHDEATMIAAIVGEIVRRVDMGLAARGAAVAELLPDWERGAESSLFAVPGAAEPSAQHVQRDLERIASTMDGHVPGALVCIDEGHRMHPRVLSTLKNALHSLRSFLIVFSIYIPAAHDVAAEARQRLREMAQHSGRDYGADAFLTTGLEIGPFKDDDEAHACIASRLENNAISFSEEVAQRVIEIGERVPRLIIKLAGHVYDAADRDQDAAMATLEHLERGFHGLHDAEVAESRRICNELPQGAREALACLLELRRPATADEVAEAMYEGLDARLGEQIGRVIAGDLDLAHEMNAIEKEDDRYLPPTPALAYALELTLQG